MDHLGFDKFMVLGFCIGGPFIWNLIKRAGENVPTGFDIEIAKLIASKLGVDIELADALDRLLQRRRIGIETDPGALAPFPRRSTTSTGRGCANGPGRPSSRARSPRSHRSTNVAKRACRVVKRKRSP